ncbi:MAG TPA: HAD family hydrolase [Methylomirabilota bacterium]|nr:HAD family hydrolase [Methylomirabilota bacterium]
MPIRVVTFDFWETLVQDSPDNLRAQRDLRIQALRRALEQAGAPRPEAEVAEAHDRSAEVLRERFWSRHRDPSHADQVRLVLDCAVPGLAGRLPGPLFEELVEGYITPVLRYPPALVSGAAETVRTLVARGVKVGIISNTGRTPGVILRRLLEQHALLRHFAVISYSDEIGYRKPDAEIFLRTLRLAGAAPAQAAHVGDNPLDDVTGAQGVGMRAIHYAVEGRVPAAHADLTVTDLAQLPARLERL